jgi:hypothetical protein
MSRSKKYQELISARPPLVFFTELEEGLNIAVKNFYDAQMCGLSCYLYHILSLNIALLCTALGHLLFLTCKLFTQVLTSVADPGCLSRIPDPDFYRFRIPDLGSRIPDPKTATKESGEKKFVVRPFL